MDEMYQNMSRIIDEKISELKEEERQKEFDLKLYDN